MLHAPYKRSRHFAEFNKDENFAKPTVNTGNLLKYVRKMREIKARTLVETCQFSPGIPNDSSGKYERKKKIVLSLSPRQANGGPTPQGNPPLS